MEYVIKRLRRIDSPGEESVASFIGGMRFGLFNATIPLVRLEFFPRYLRLSASVRLLRRLIPVLEADYSDIKDVQIVTNWLSSGIRIRTRDNESSPVFWTSEPEVVLSRLKEIGMNTKGDRGRFYFTNPDK